MVLGSFCVSPAFDFLLNVFIFLFFILAILLVLSLIFLLLGGLISHYCEVRNDVETMVLIKRFMRSKEFTEFVKKERAFGTHFTD